MTWLYVLAGITAFFAWLLTRKIHIGVGFIQKPMAFVRIFFFKLTIPSDKATDDKKAAESEEQTAKKKKKTKKEKKPKEPLPKKTVGEYIEIFKDALCEVIDKLKKYLFLEKFILKADIGTDDAAKTALLYGSACTAFSSLWTVISRIKRRTNKKELIMTEIKPDFISEKTDFYADIVISIRIWQILSLGMTALGVYKKLKKTVR